METRAVLTSARSAYRSYLSSWGLRASKYSQCAAPRWTTAAAAPAMRNWSLWRHVAELALQLRVAPEYEWRWR